MERRRLLAVPDPTLADGVEERALTPDNDDRVFMSPDRSPDRSPIRNERFSPPSTDMSTTPSSRPAPYAFSDISSPVSRPPPPSNTDTSMVECHIYSQSELCDFKIRIFCDLGFKCKWRR